MPLQIKQREKQKKFEYAEILGLLVPKISSVQDLPLEAQLEARDLTDELMKGELKARTWAVQMFCLATQLLANPRDRYTYERLMRETRNADEETKTAIETGAFEVMEPMLTNLQNVVSEFYAGLGDPTGAEDPNAGEGTGSEENPSTPSPSQPKSPTTTPASSPRSRSRTKAN